MEVPAFGLYEDIKFEDPGFLIFLLLPVWCWDYRHAPQHLTYSVLGTETRALYMPGKLSTNRAQLRTPLFPHSCSTWRATTAHLVSVMFVIHQGREKDRYTRARKTLKCIKLGYPPLGGSREAHKTKEVPETKEAQDVLRFIGPCPRLCEHNNCCRGESRVEPLVSRVGDSRDATCTIHHPC